MNWLIGPEVDILNTISFSWCLPGICCSDSCYCSRKCPNNCYCVEGYSNTPLE